MPVVASTITQTLRYSYHKFSRVWAKQGNDLDKMKRTNVFQYRRFNRPRDLPNNNNNNNKHLGTLSPSAAAMATAANGAAFAFLEDVNGASCRACSST